MVLFGILGELGSGKTLGLTYLAWHNWFNKGRKIFSNYNLYGFPFTKISTLPDLDKMKSGFFAGDELWLWLDSWGKRDDKKRMVSSILLKSRKRDITIAYTSQTVKQIVKRVRDVTDFLAYPIMFPDNSACKMLIMRGGTDRPVPVHGQPPLYFNCEPVFAMYDTREEVQLIAEYETPMKEMFFDISKNRTFIDEYLVKERKFPESRISPILASIRKAVNPDNVKSEDERKDIVESMSAI